MRDVIVGKNSKVWSSLAKRPLLRDFSGVALGHKDVSEFEFSKNDRVWIFSYSRNFSENKKLLDLIASRNVGEIVYIGSTSVVVTSLTSCYSYPNAKSRAEVYAMRIKECRVLTLGAIVEDQSTLASGPNLVTTLDALAKFILNPVWLDFGRQRKNLFERVWVPFEGKFESALYSIYGWVIRACGPVPCIIRPLDFVLKFFGYRWYGYSYLGNRMWANLTI